MVFRWPAVAAALLSACGTENLTPCRAGFARAADGHCYPPPPDPDPPTANDVLDALGPCVWRKDGVEIDVLGGCVETACADDTFQEVDFAFGGEASCDLNAAETEWVCIWPQDVEAWFPIDEDDDGGPVPDTKTEFVRARTLYEGASAEGLGIGVSPGCFVQVYGVPTTATFVDGAGVLLVQQLVWENYGLEIEDEERAFDDATVPDGLVDEVTLTGPP